MTGIGFNWCNSLSASTLNGQIDMLFHCAGCNMAGGLVGLVGHSGSSASFRHQFNPAKLQRISANNTLESGSNQISE